MGFTQPTIGHTFTNSDGSACSGSVQATLSAMMTNGSTSIFPASPPSGNLSGSGVLSLPLWSNLDAGTVPQDTSWRLDIRIAGCEPQTVDIVVPSGNGTVELGSLLPGAQQVN